MKLKEAVAYAKGHYGRGYISVDSDNEIWWFPPKPIANNKYNIWHIIPQNIPYRYTGNKHWTETLRKVT